LWSGAAGESRKKVLKAGAVEHFIKTFPALKKDLEKFGMKYEGSKGDITFPTALRASKEVLQVLKKHGWDENYYLEASTIIFGYSAVVYEKEMKKADSEMEKSLKEIDANPNIAPEMKKQLKDQLKATRGILNTQGNVMQKNIHPDDLKLITPHLNEIKDMLDRLDKKVK
ncbi:MAG: hypothetical protein L0Y73_04225, partial [Candidatus Aminicenantes bacterium]|nr:hypothetical protein [Candidatus Aminicenantes bacterium]